VKQLADEEAERVEAEEAEAAAAEDEHEAGHEPEPEPEQPEPEPAEPEGAAEPLSLEAFAAAAEAEGERHNAALREMYGADYDAFEVCPLCNFLGVVHPDAMMLDPDTIKCPQCRGWGSFVTESQVENHLVRQCPRCMGNGYIDKAFAMPDAPTFQADGAPAPAVAVEIPPMPYYDPGSNTWKTPDGQPLVAAAS
jgi:hypothetical protein